MARAMAFWPPNKATKLSTEEVLPCMSVEPLTENAVGCQPLFSVTPRAMARGRAPKVPISERPEWTQRLIAARNATGLSQEQFADAAEIPQTTYQGYETGKAQPDFAQMKRIADHLGASADFIAFGPSEPTSDSTFTGALIERHKNDEGFVVAFLQVAAMLNDEGFNADLHFTAVLALRLSKEAKALSQDMTLRERISATVAQERTKVRAEIERVRKNLLQP